MNCTTNNQQNNQRFFEISLWDINKTAIMLSVSPATLRDWVYKRQIPFKKIGNLIRFVPSEIQQWIEERNQYGHRKN